MVPPIFYGLSIIGTWTRFPLLGASMPLSNLDPVDATHVSLLTLFGFFFFLCLLFDPSALQVPISIA